MNMGGGLPHVGLFRDQQSPYLSHNPWETKTVRGIEVAGPLAPPSALAGQRHETHKEKIHTLD
jgi:hypothetical protein